MTNLTKDPAIYLELKRTYPVPRERVFRAWTDPAQLKKWFAVAEGFSTPIAEVDLKVGGRYRIGMQAPDSDEVMVAGGVYREISQSDRLVFTWQWESPSADEPVTLVTVEFHERNNATEVILKHERFTNIAQRDKHGEGWIGCMNNLERLLIA
ncbi:MAG TPA: SRPBCC domain-containing protein [Anaerolineae bacterium]|nr:SRPBCC domain-containing protein [Anaerolineae bacterium]